jgi:hypothetical protein
MAQAMHALAIDVDVLGAADVARMQRMKQGETLDRITALRGWLPAELGRVPILELARIITAISGKQPSTQQLAFAVSAYGDH